jgi:hypothetical protein
MHECFCSLWEKLTYSTDIIVPGCILFPPSYRRQSKAVKVYLSMTNVLVGEWCHGGSNESERKVGFLALKLGGKVE